MSQSDYEKALCYASGLFTIEEIEMEEEEDEQEWGREFTLTGSTDYKEEMKIVGWGIEEWCESEE